MPCIVYIVNLNYCGSTFLQGDTIRIKVENDFKLNAQGEPFPTTYSPVSNQQVTAAHEFFHLIQFDTYGQRSYDWWMEATAGWMEDEVYDGLNVYTEYLSNDRGSIFKIPQYSLDDIADLNEFTCLIYPKLLAERNSRDIIRQIWQQITLEPDRYNAIQTVLGGEAAFKDFFKTFVAANYLKDEPGGYIDDAAPSYPEITKVKTYFTANNTHYAKSPPPAVGQPVEWEQGTFSEPSMPISLPHLASHYIHYMKPARVDTATTLYVSFEGQGASGIWGLMGVKTRGADKEKFEIPLDANNRVEDYAVTLEPNVSEVVFIPCNLDKEVGETPYKYSLCCVPVFRAAYSPDPANGTTKRVRNLDEDNKYAPGDTVRLLVSLSDKAHLEDRYTLTADFSEVDNGFDPSRVKVSVSNAEANEYLIKYPLSKNIKASSGLLPVKLKVKDLTDSEAHQANEVIYYLRTLKVPKVLRTEPERGEKGVPVDRKIKLCFNLPMDTTTVDSNSVRFKPDLIDGFNIKWNEGLDEVVITPRDTAKDLRYSTKYTVTLSDEIKDTTGAKLDGDA